MNYHFVLSGINWYLQKSLFAMVSAQRFIICQHLVLSKTKSLREKTREKRETINSLADALYNQARFLKLKGSETDRSALGAEQQV